MICAEPGVGQLLTFIPGIALSCEKGGELNSKRIGTNRLSVKF